LTRIPLAAGAAWFLWEGGAHGVAFGLLAAAVLTDVLDGYFARRFDAVSLAGKTLDPLVDKVSIALVGVVLVAKYNVPWWLFAGVVARDVAIVVGGAVLWRRRNDVQPSNVWGKAAAAAMAAYGLIAIWVPGGVIRTAALVTVIILGAASCLSYAKRFWDMARAKTNRPDLQ